MRFYVHFYRPLLFSNPVTLKVASFLSECFTPLQLGSSAQLQAGGKTPSGAKSGDQEAGDEWDKEIESKAHGWEQVRLHKLLEIVYISLCHATTARICSYYFGSATGSVPSANTF